MKVFRSKVNMSDELIIQTSVSAEMISRRWIIFVYAEDLDILERHLTFLVEPHQLTVEIYRRGSRRESESVPAPRCIDGFYDFRCEDLARNFLTFIYISRYPLIAMEDTVRKTGLYQTAIFRQRKLLHELFKNFNNRKDSINFLSKDVFT